MFYDDTAKEQLKVSIAPFALIRQLKTTEQLGAESIIDKLEKMGTQQKLAAGEDSTPPQSSSTSPAEDTQNPKKAPDE